MWDNYTIEELEIKADKGDIEAMYHLGGRKLNGTGTTKSKALGLFWLNRSAFSGHIPAKHFLNFLNFLKK